MPRKTWMLGSGAIILITLLIYIPALRAGFIWDDDHLVTNNRLVRSSDGILHFWYTSETPDYFPLVYSAFWLQWHLWGMHAVGYHVVNVLLHAGSAILVWLVLRRLSVPGALLAAGIFAVHPVNVATVAWISELKNTLAMPFYLLTILLFLKFEGDRRTRWYVLSLVAFVLALLSKTAVVTLPVILLLCLWYLRGRIGVKAVLRLAPFFVLSVILGLVTVWFQYHKAIGDEIVRPEGFFSRLAAAGWAVWFYIYKTLIPYKLIMVYPRWQVDAKSVVSYLPGLMLLAVFVLLWVHRKTWVRGVLFALSYHVITLFPVLGFFDMYFCNYSLVADHWQYFSIIGVIACVVGLAWSVCRRQSLIVQRSALVAAAAVLVLLGALTWRQALTYKDQETLWRYTLAKNDQCWIGYYNLGTTLAVHGRIQEAVEYLATAIKLKPDYVAAYNNLGLALAQQGKVAEAIPYYRQALEIQPDLADAHNNLGLALVQQGRFDEALKHYAEALKYRPDYAEACHNIGLALAKQDKIDPAINYFVMALKLKPDYADAYHNLGFLLAKKGRIDDAVAHYAKALQLKPNYPEAHHNLGLVLARQGKLAEAIHQFALAIKGDPNHVDAHNNLGTLLAQQGRFAEAMTLFTKALELKPEHADAHNNLGLALLEQGRPDQAVPHFQKALQIKPDHASAHNNLGLALARQGKFDQAIGHYTQAIKINPNVVLAYKNLAIAYAQLGETDRAIEWFRKGLSIEPADADSHYQLGLALASQQKINDAAGELREALRLNPRHGQAQAALDALLKLKLISPTQPASRPVRD